MAQPPTKFDAKRLLKSVILDRGAAVDVIASFDVFLRQMVPQVIAEHSAVSVKSDVTGMTHSLKLSNPRFEAPTVYESSGTRREVTALECLARMLTYSLTVRLDAEYTVSTPRGVIDTKLVTNHAFDTVPCLKGSALTVTDREKEDAGDPGGYFVINGQERILVQQEAPHCNAAMVTLPTDAGDGKLEYRARGAKLRSTSTLFMHFKPAYPTATEQERRCVQGAVQVTIPFTDPVDLGALFRVLGVRSAAKMAEYMLSPSDPAWFRSRVMDVLTSNCEAFFTPVPQLVRRLARDRVSRQGGRADAARCQKALDALLRSEFFPHQGCASEDLAAKTVLLGDCARKLLRTVYLLREPDDRDDYRNRRMMSAAQLLGPLFRHLFGEWRCRVAGAFKRCKTPKFANIDDLLSSGGIGSQLCSAVATGNFSLQRASGGGANAAMTGVAQQLIRIEPHSVISHVQRSTNPVSREGAAVKPRLQDTSSFGIVDAFESPDGHQCGLMRNKCAAAGVRQGYPLADIAAAVRLAAGDLLDPAPRAVGRRPPPPHAAVYVTGAWLGTVPDGAAFRDTLRALRAVRDLPIDVSIYAYEGELHVRADGGSLHWPLLRADRLPRLAQILRDHPGESTGLWHKVLHAGCAELVNKDEEAVHVRVALDHASFRAEPPGTFTHVVIHPSQMLSTFTARGPLLEFNQSPRVTFQATQSKQAIGRPLRTSRLRFDNCAYTLWGPEKPLTTTWMDDVLGSSSTQMVMAAILCYTGYNIEDSIIVSKGAIDRGLFRGFVERSHSTSVRMGDAEAEKLMLPPPGCSQRRAADYSKVDPATGVVPPGTRVKMNDVLVSKIAVVSSRGAEGSQTNVARDRSAVFKTDEEAVVADVARCKTLSGEQLYRVRTRSMRLPEVGCKFSCLTPEHQVLCRGGRWVPIAQVTVTHDVACMRDDAVIYRRPEVVHTYTAPSIPVILFKAGGKLNLQVTHDHRLALRDADGNVELLCAAGAVRERQRLRHCVAATHGHGGLNAELPVVVWAEQTAKERDTPMLPLLHATLRLLGAIHAEYGASWPKRFQLMDEDLMHVCGPIEGKRLPACLDRLVERTPRPSWALELDKDRTREFLAGYMGESPNSQDRIDFIMALAVHAGMHVTTTTRGNLHLIQDKVELECLNTAHATFRRTNDPVHCLTVPGGIFCVRRGSWSSPVWTGNSRHGQKGTIGAILPQEDMPFRQRDGIPMDVLFNPNCIPSRMTWGQILEMLGSKLAAATGEPFDGTPFQVDEDWATAEPESTDAVIDALGAALEAAGGSRSGREVLVDGRSGREMRCQVFCGPLAMMKLKHEVRDKVHARARGPRVAATNQPVVGRSNGGGSRFGEMERDATLSHGASHFLQDRLFHCSDRKMVPVCVECGMLGASGPREAGEHSRFTGKSFCQKCLRHDTVQMVPLPGGWHLTANTMAALHLKARYLFAQKR